MPEPFGRFTRRPIPGQVAAVQLVDDDECDWEAIAVWCGGSLVNHEIADSGEYETRLILGDNHHGGRTCFAGDWVVTDGSGFFWMLTADGFAEIYEPAPPMAALELPVEQLGLSTRSLNALLREGCRTAGQVVSLTAADLMDIRYFGTAMLAEVRQVLRRAGLALAGDES